MSGSVELVVDAKASLGEGPIWDERDSMVRWIDIDRHMVHSTNPITKADNSINVGQMVGAIVPRKSGGLMLAMEKGFASLDLATQRLTLIANPESHKSGNRFNDGKVDPAGRFWAGTMSINEVAGAGTLYRLDKDFSVHAIYSPVTVSNGLAWSSDHHTMYYIDTPTRVVLAFDYDIDSGSARNAREVVRIAKEDGMPDGMSIDAEDMLWVAHWGGSCVTRWNPRSGKLIGKTLLPAEQITSCCFGGPNLETLFITSARIGLNETALARQPLAGGLFRVSPGVQGTKTESFAG